MLIELRNEKLGFLNRRHLPIFIVFNLSPLSFRNLIQRQVTSKALKKGKFIGSSFLNRTIRT